MKITFILILILLLLIGCSKDVQKVSEAPEGEQWCSNDIDCQSMDCPLELPDVDGAKEWNKECMGVCACILTVEVEIIDEEEKIYLEKTGSFCERIEDKYLCRRTISEKELS